MQYPIFVSVAEAAKLLRLGKTSIFARIQDGSLKAAKMQRCTRITFSSVIEYALRSLQQGNGAGTLSEIFGNGAEVKSWMVADMFAGQLCNTHSEPTEVLGIRASTNQSPASNTLKNGSPEKNFGGEL